MKNTEWYKKTKSCFLAERENEIHKNNLIVWVQYDKYGAACFVWSQKAVIVYDRGNRQRSQYQAKVPGVEGVVK